MELGDREYLLTGAKNVTKCMLESNTWGKLVDSRNPFLVLLRRSLFLFFVPKSRFVRWPSAEIPGFDEEAAKAKLLALFS